MTGPVLADANAIVYRFETADPRKQSRAVDWFTLLWNRRSGRVSFPAVGAGGVRGAEAEAETGDRIGKAHGGRLPKVLDLSANGSATPLEAARLGCESRALDASSRTPRVNEGSGGQAGCA